MTKCDVCKGKGKISKKITDTVTTQEKCTRCNGKGVLKEDQVYWWQLSEDGLK